MMYPKQSKTVHVEVLNDELCLYDWQRKEVHALNPTAALVWQMCDGQTSPQQMAGQLKGDLTPAQAEALVWTSLEQLGKAHLLEGEIAKPDGGPLLTRRQVLKLLGGAAAGAVLMPVVSSIVAPTPVAAQSPGGDIVMYDGGAHDGDMGGRTGADAICQASPSRPAGFANYRAFISIDANDEIRDMPANYGVPTSLPIIGPTGTLIANNWADLLDGSIAASLSAAGVVSSSWHTGSAVASDGSLEEEPFDAHCAGYASTTGNTRIANPTLTTGGVYPTVVGWLGSGNGSCSPVAWHVVCIAY